MTKSEFHDYFAQQMNRTFVVDGEKFNLVQLGWEYGYCKTRRAIGRCRYSYADRSVRQVQISEYYLAMKDQNNETMKDCVLHEIAHAIDVERRGTTDHSAEWKYIARAVGADDTRTTDQIVQPKGRYTLHCKNCGNTSEKYRRPTRKSACGKCCKKHAGGRYDDRFEMTIIDNQTDAVVRPVPQRRKQRNPWIGFGV